jgi:hypothetical protein
MREVGENSNYCRLVHLLAAIIHRLGLRYVRCYGFRASKYPVEYKVTCIHVEFQSPQVHADGLITRKPHTQLALILFLIH